MLRTTRRAGTLFAGLLAVGTLAAAIVPPPARANDSSARLDTGGLSFVYDARIRMASEDLFLSRSRVEVRYVFENRTDRDVETLVAFPLPKIDTGEGGNYAIDSDDPINFIDFRILVDGRPVEPKVEARARAMGVDVTDLLGRLGLPLTTVLPRDDAARTRFWERLRTLPEDGLAELERRGAIARSRDDAGKTTDVNPIWTASITFYWFQTFPAGRTIEIVHRYRPVPRDFMTGMDEIAGPDAKKRWCTDASFLATAREMAAKGQLVGVDLRYVVRTAANWWGPIGRFTLTVDKESPDVFLSTCLSGLQKVGPTTFRLEKPDFMPSDDIDLLFLKSVKIE